MAKQNIRITSTLNLFNNLLTRTNRLRYNGISLHAP